MVLDADERVATESSVLCYHRPEHCAGSDQAADRRADRRGHAAAGLVRFTHALADRSATACSTRDPRRSSILGAGS
jgi:hypothetical protein